MLAILIVTYNKENVQDGHIYDLLFVYCTFVCVCVPVSLSHSSSNFGEKVPRHLEWFDVGFDEGKI